jgi:hypothetical protein
VVDFRLFHAPLAVFIPKKREHLVKRLIGAIDHVLKCSSLTILKEFLSR